MDKLEAIRQSIRKFRQERIWEKYHTPKNLSMSIAIEAAELMEHFQWAENGNAELESQHRRDEVLAELADVFIYAFNLADILNADVYWIIRDKLLANEAKYPAVNGRSK